MLNSLVALFAKRPIKNSWRQPASFDAKRGRPGGRSSFSEADGDAKAAVFRGGHLIVRHGVSPRQIARADSIA